MAIPGAAPLAMLRDVIRERDPRTDESVSEGCGEHATHTAVAGGHAARDDIRAFTPLLAPAYALHG
eukprot:scaffold25561_cov112-Isochrysis_galbana.AAC.2